MHDRHQLFAPYTVYFIFCSAPGPYGQRPADKLCLRTPSCLPTRARPRPLHPTCQLQLVTAVASCRRLACQCLHVATCMPCPLAPALLSSYSWLSPLHRLLQPAHGLFINQVAIPACFPSMHSERRTLMPTLPAPVELTAPTPLRRPHEGLGFGYKKPQKTQERGWLLGVSEGVEKKQKRGRFGLSTSKRERRG